MIGFSFHSRKSSWCEYLKKRTPGDADAISGSFILLMKKQK